MPRQQLIKFRTGSSAPTAADFQVAEPAWDGTNKKLYLKAADGTMVDVTAGGANQADYGLVTEAVSSSADYGGLT